MVIVAVPLRVHASTEMDIQKIFENKTFEDIRVAYELDGAFDDVLRLHGFVNLPEVEGVARVRREEPKKHHRPPPEPSFVQTVFQVCQLSMSFQ